MKKFMVDVSVKYVQTLLIEAKSVEEALEKAQLAYLKSPDVDPEQFCCAWDSYKVIDELTEEEWEKDEDNYTII